jgi:hypothetical protein
MGSLLYAVFGGRPAQPLYALIDATDRYLERVETLLPYSRHEDDSLSPSPSHPHPPLLLFSQSDHYAFCLAFSVPSRFPNSRLSTAMRKRKVTAEELLARADSNSYQGILAERKTTLETARGTWARPRRIKTRRWVAISYKGSVSMVLTCTKVNILTPARTPGPR